ncbi:phospotransferase system (PTS), enzyme II component D [Streptococcus pyogenes]|nr:phospotransferase system (PTS), enzyme II component D [Streptococcus pyogenes]
MTASNVKFKTILTVAAKGAKEAASIQDYLDQLFIGIVPLMVTLAALLGFYERIVNINWIMFGIMFLGIILGPLGIC